MNNKRLIETYKICGLITPEDISKMRTSIKDIDDGVSIKDLMSLLVKYKDNLGMGNILDLCNVLVKNNDSNVIESIKDLLKLKLKYLEPINTKGSIIDIIEEIKYNNDYSSEHIKSIIEKERLCTITLRSKVILNETRYKVTIKSSSYDTELFSYFNLVHGDDTIENIGLVIIEKNDIIRMLRYDNLRDKKAVERFISTYDIDKMDLMITLNINYRYVSEALEERQKKLG